MMIGGHCATYIASDLVGSARKSLKVKVLSFQPASLYPTIHSDLVSDRSYNQVRGLPRNCRSSWSSLVQPQLVVFLRTNSHAHSTRTS